MSEKQLPYPRFYKENGIRFLVNIKTPKLKDYNSLVLPISSILHWIDYDGKYLVGPPQDEPILTRTSDRMYAEAINKYPENPKDGWIIAKNNTQGLFTKYDSENPNIKRMTKMVNEYVSREILPIFTYNLLSTTYLYKKYLDSELNRWTNYHYTVFQTALATSKVSDRQQFIELDVPKSFPTFQNIKKGASGIDKSNIRYLPNSDHWLILSFWNLIAGNGNDFIFANYELDDFKKINIIWKSDDKFTIMNMWVMLSFAHGKKATVSPAKLQVRLVKMFITVNQASILAAKLDEELVKDIEDFTDDNSDVENDIEEDIDRVTDDYGETEEIEELNPFKRAVINNTKQQMEYNASRNFISPDTIILDDDDANDTTDEDESAELEQTLNLVSIDIDASTTGYTSYVPKEISADSVITDDGAKLVKAGVLAVGSYERMQRLAKDSGSILDPLNPNLSITEASLITKTDITIPPVNNLGIKSNDILDKSMGNSSLSKFNEQYIEKVYHKDILNAVMSIQRGGLVIKDYQIDKIETVNDKYNIHKVQIETLKGHTSTLSFKVPVVETDGTFKSGGSRRYMRKQRGDKNTDTFYVIS